MCLFMKKKIIFLDKKCVPITGFNVLMEILVERLKTTRKLVSMHFISK